MLFIDSFATLSFTKFGLCYRNRYVFLAYRNMKIVFTEPELATPMLQIKIKEVKSLSTNFYFTKQISRFASAQHTIAYI